MADEGFSNCLRAWRTRSLDSVFQKVNVLNTFALPKIWYKALLLPLPGKVASKLEEEMRNFIWKGKLEKPAMIEMFNSWENGGLGLTCVRTKADSLLLKQTLRMMEDKTTLHHKHLQFWLGNFLEQNWPDMLNHPHARRTGVIVDRPLTKEAALTPHYEKLLLGIRNGERTDDFDYTNIKKITAKMLYQLNTTTFPPPSIVHKRNVPDWQLVWARVASPMLEPRGREVMYMVVNNIFPTQERMVRLGKTDREVCKKCNLGVVEDCQHMFMECQKAREGWLWVRRRIMSLLVDLQGLSNWEILHLTFPKDARMENEVVWLLGQWVQLVSEEVVVKGRNLKDQFVRGHFRYKFFESLSMKMPQLNHITEVTVMDPG